MSTSLLNENARLAALDTFNASGETPDQIFSHIVQLAATCFQVPTSVIILLDKDRQIYFEKFGSTVSECPRDGAICAQTITQDGPLVVLDASLDPVWSETRFVKGEPHLRFYAGVPVCFRGQPIGTFCLVDTRPRNRFTPDERERLERFGRIVEELFVLRALRAERLTDGTRFERMAATIPDALIVSDDEGRILAWNPGAERLLGHSAARASELTVCDMLPDRIRPASGEFASYFRRFVGSTEEMPLRLADGSVRTVEFSLTRWTEDGRTLFGGVARDVSGRKAMEGRLQRLAHHDALTELPNRTVFHARLGDALAGGGRAAILLVDLDGFKEVNDTAGHAVGDAVLKVAAARMLECVSPADTVARLGGDEFVILLPDRADPLTAGEVADRLLAALALPFDVHERSIRLGASIGIALGPGHGAGADDLLSAADLALYDAKRSGRQCRRMFTPVLRDRAAEQRRFAREIARAVEAGEFALFYQPQLRLSDGAVIGAEALLRWRHPQHGLLLPAAFLSAVAESRHAADVGRFVARTACRQATRWRSMGHPDFRMAINACPAQLRAGTLATETFTALEEARLPPANLEIEITETVMLSGDETSIGPLFALRDAGVGIAFDDYGTGYASLSMLKNYPVTCLKIDRSFVRGTGGVADRTIISAILQLAAGFGLQVIAEGIETGDQLAALKRQGCYGGQGFLFGRPVPADVFERDFILDPRRRASA